MLILSSLVVVIIACSYSEYVGLVNQAMTCYLNSMLQTLFMTPEFRNAIYRFLFCYKWINIIKLKESKNRELVPDVVGYTPIFSWIKEGGNLSCWWGSWGCWGSSFSCWILIFWHLEYKADYLLLGNLFLLWLEWKYSTGSLELVKHLICGVYAAKKKETTMQVMPCFEHVLLDCAKPISLHSVIKRS